MIDDTICAPATPLAHSSIAIVRISGPDTMRAVTSIFRPSKEIKPRYALYGRIISQDGPVDDVIMVYYQSPRSYTGEDMAEIFCHGNPIILQKIIMLLNGLGVRFAEPGEFTRRAFLNGKVDLTEAEAINHIVTAKSEWEIETSLKQMHGSLKSVIREIRGRVIECKADIEANIDFTEEDIGPPQQDKMSSEAKAIQGLLEDLLGRCRAGDKLSQGIDITIAGKPNVGKSSVLNLLLNQERAIVSSIPGTTRDVIRELFQVGGMHVNLNDTAGIDIPGDEIEKIGINLSWQKIESSQFIIMVLDAKSGVGPADMDILEQLRGRKKIVLINKTDIASQEEIDRAAQAVNQRPVFFSAKTGKGLAELKSAMSDLIKNEFIDIESSFIADMRIAGLLEKSLDTIKRAVDLLANGEPVEIIAFELQSLLDSLSEITGEITPEDILDSIFSRFCIGK